LGAVYWLRRLEGPDLDRLQGKILTLEAEPIVLPESAIVAAPQASLNNMQSPGSINPNIPYTHWVSVTSGEILEDVDFGNHLLATLTVTLGATTVVENAGPAATTVTITRTASTTSELVVNLTSSDPTEATVPARATIPAGQPSVTVSLDAVDDALLDGAQTVTIRATEIIAGGTGLDPGFGESGYAATPLHVLTSDSRPGLVILPDGSIIGVGDDATGSDNAWQVVKVTPAGQLDATFGSGGVVATSFGTGGGLPHAVALQADGKIVVAGEADGGATIDEDIALARYSADGSLDTSFADAGKLRIEFDTGHASAYDLLVLPDGKLLVIGVGPLGVFLMSRLNSDGSLDATFGTGGTLTIPNTIAGSALYYTDAELMPDGRHVYVAGAYDNAVSVFDRNVTTGRLSYRFVTKRDGIGFLSGVRSVAVSPDGLFVYAGEYTANALTGMYRAQGRPGPTAYQITLGVGEVVEGLNFGNVSTSGEIRGTKWNDLDGDGQRDTGEPGLGNVKVYIDLDNNRQFDPIGEPSVLTASDGSYSFTGLGPGTYTVAEIVPDGWTQTWPDPGQGGIERVSAKPDGSSSNADSLLPALSADGRYIVFTTPASDLLPGDTAGFYDIYLVDRQTGARERVTILPGGVEPNGHCFYPAISDDGRFVAFASTATNLGAGGTSGDGRYVAFFSYASNLVPGDTNATFDMFVYDRLTASTRRVNVAGDGSEATVGPEYIYGLAISDDGAFVAFTNKDTNLVPGDIGGFLDVYVASTTARLPGTCAVALAAGAVQQNVDFGNRLNLPTVTLSVDKATIAEAAGVATFTATLSAASGLPVTVDLGFTGTAKLTDDYTRSGTQIIIAAGSLTGSLTVTSIDDAIVEGNETAAAETTFCSARVAATPC